MQSLGIDYDGGQWMVAAWDEEAAADLRVLPAPGDVWEFVDEVLSLHPATPIVLPSGLGVPLTRAADLMDQDIAEKTLDAAVIAAGLTGGPTAGLVQHLGLREARERVLDSLHAP